MSTFDQVKDIKKAFTKEYMFPVPWRHYVNLCSISKIGILNANAPEEEKNNPCLRVGLVKQLPPDMNIPSEYRGIKVFVSIVGEIKFL